MKDDYISTAQSDFTADYISDSLQKVSQTTGISVDSIAYTLKVMGYYLLKATKASGKFIADITKFSLDMLSLTYNINELEIKKHVMERDIGIEVVKFAIKYPHIVKEFDDRIQSMFTDYDDMERQSYDYTAKRQQQLSSVIDKIDDKLSRLDIFLKDSEERLRESRNKLRFHLDDQPYERNFDRQIKPDTKPYKPYEKTESRAENPIDLSKEVMTMADSILKDKHIDEKDVEEIKTYSTTPYQVPEYIPDASPLDTFQSEQKSNNEDINPDSLASLNQRLIELEDIKSQNDSLKNTIQERINNYKAENNPQLSNEEALEIMLPDDPDLNNIVNEQLEIAGKLNELLETTK